MKAFAASMTGLLSICACACDRDHTTRSGSEDPVVKVPPAPVSSLVHEPDWYRGKSVRVAGEVEKVHNPRAFTLEGDASWWAHDITVITKTPVEFVGIPLDDDDDVMVTGHIAVGAAEVERELGRTLEPDVARVIGDRPVLIARTVRLVDEDGAL